MATPGSLPSFSPAAFQLSTPFATASSPAAPPLPLPANTAGNTPLFSGSVRSPAVLPPQQAQGQQGPSKKQRDEQQIAGKTRQQLRLLLGTSAEEIAMGAGEQEGAIQTIMRLMGEVMAMPEGPARTAAQETLSTHLHLLLRTLSSSPLGALKLGQQTAIRDLDSSELHDRVGKMWKERSRLREHGDIVSTILSAGGTS